MRARTVVVLCAPGLFAAGCVTHNHRFEDRLGGPPDIATLERTRQEKLAATVSADSLADLAWYPLVRLDLEAYGPTKSFGYPEGTTYTDFDYWGPLFFAGGIESYRYDTEQRLYERETESRFLWGLWGDKQTTVKVPSGWHVDSEWSLLFGLLRWPSKTYVESAWFDPQEPSTPPAEAARP